MCSYSKKGGGRVGFSSSGYIIMADTNKGGWSLSFSSVSNVWGWGWAVPFLSADVNFALELSDLRHRHGFHIILIHKSQASEALLHHANELIRFEEFISDLPPRSPLKMPVSEFAFFLLYSSIRLGRLKKPLARGFQA